MAEQAEYRLYKRKRLKDPNDENNYLDIPVIYEARFKCIADQAQEVYIFIDNSITSSRKVHTKRVTNNQDSSQYIDVERIEEWNVKTVQEQAQETTFILTNTDPPPIQSDGSNNPAHEGVHYVRYFKNNNPNNDTWCDIELIDQLKVKCLAEQAQEYIWFTKHPELRDPVNDPDVPYTLTTGYCNPDVELAAAGEGIDPPYRLDPFQNIINVNWFSEESSATSNCEPYEGDYSGFSAVINWYQADEGDLWYDAVVNNYVEFGIAYSDLSMMAALSAEPNQNNPWGAYWFVGVAEGSRNGISAYLKPKGEGLPPCNPVEPPPDKAIPPEWWE